MTTIAKLRILSRLKCVWSMAGWGGGGGGRLAEAATSIIFVATKVFTKHVICREKNMLVATKLCLSRQTFCRNKHNFVATKDVFVATKMILVAAPASDRVGDLHGEKPHHWCFFSRPLKQKYQECTLLLPLVGARCNRPLNETWLTLTSFVHYVCIITKLL